jgi:hypothetical protein
MSRDAKEDNDKTKLDGNRWSSARPDKGSVTSYAKDVQQRILKKKTEPVLTATAEGRRAVRNAKVTGDYKTKEVNNWNVQDVAQWLTSMMLDQYTQVFLSNQIDGPILLDISLDDLDYIEIKVLGHRKIILRGIEDLRNNKKVTIPLFASNTPTNENTVPIQHDIQLRSKDDNVSKSLSAINDNDNKKLIHWSHLEPLSTNDNPDKDSSNINVNPADGDYNEAAEQAAFMEAVLEWRQGGKKGNTKIEREFETEKQNDGMWHNPFAAPSTSLIDDSDVDSPTTHSDVKGSSFNKNKGASSLLTGELDEEAEREEFKKAVEAWRQNKPSGTVTVTNMVDELSKQLDEEQKSSALRIQMQKQEMQRRLDEANMEYAQMKKEQALKNGPEQISNEIDINDSDDEYDYNYNHSEDSKSESKYSPIPHSNTYSSKYTPDNSSKELTLENFTPENDNSAKFSYVPEVEVKLVESYEYKGEDIGNDCYVVEENSDDDS